jgi:putative DNA primase/helicase
MSDLNFDPERLRYIELRGDGSKLPANSWGGYDQNFEQAEHVRTLDEVEMFPMDNWGVVDIEDPPHGSFALLIFDIDVHKAPDDFDVDRVGIPADTLVTRSQNGGFHAYFVISGCRRGDLNESDFQMTADPGFDVDIRGSAVSHHVVAPADIPGVGGDYEVVNDNEITTYFEPAEAADRITLDADPLLEFSPDATGVDYDFDVPTEAPEEMPTCYHAGLELRKAAPDDHPNTHKVNMLTAACGLAAGYSPDEVASHFCGDWAPHDGGADISDKEQTEYQVNQIDRTGYAPPSEGTLRDYGILNEGQHCDEDCPIDYHGPQDSSSPDLDVVAELDDGRDPEAEAAAVAGQSAETAETDGGAAAASAGGASTPQSFSNRVFAVLREYNDEEIQAKTARHRIAEILTQEFHFVYPEERVRGWRSTLHVYNPEEGVYEPRGEAFIEDRIERVAGDFVTNQVRNEIIGKVERMSKVAEQIDTNPERLVVGNGILDLHTGELHDYTPHEYHRTKIDTDWNPDAGDPEEIDRFFHDIVDDSDVSTLYRLIAHSLYREYIENKAAILIGSGENGKSLFLDLVEHFLGQFNVSHRELQDFSGDDYALNNLQGNLANLATEIGEQELRDTTAFKKATGGDWIDAPVKYEKPVTFKNYATMMFATNEMPTFGQDNHAIWRRWLFLEFPYTFDADDPQAKDPEPKRVIKRRLQREEEYEALLYRCQQEIQRWYEGEPLFADAMEPDAVREKMKKAAEPVFAFATECLRNADEDTFVEKSVIRAAYRAYADEEDLPRINRNEFGQRLLGLRDFTIEQTQRRVDGQRTRVYAGVELTGRGRQVIGLDEPEDESQRQVDEDGFEQAKPIVMQQLREMVEENDGKPVPREGIVWACSSDLGKVAAEQALDELAHQGEIYDTGDGYRPT